MSSPGERSIQEFRSAAEAIAIVRELAEYRPTVFGGDEWHWCGLCHESLANDAFSTHEEDCLWVRAVKWAEHRAAIEGKDV